MADVSDVFLVRGSLELIEAEQMLPTITLWQQIPASTTLTWSADADYHLVNVSFTGAASSNVCISTDGSTHTTNSSGSTQKKGAVLAIYGATNWTGFNQNTPIKKNQKITLANSSGTASGVLLFLTMDA